MYSKPVSEITTADLQLLQDDEAAENVRLEFKRNPPSKNEMLKKLTSFANTFGGDLIVGIEEGNDGCIKSIPGVDLQNGYQQKVTQWCFDGASPPLNVEVSVPIVSPQDAAKFCYVLRISESENAPYFINGRRGVYVRTNEQSQRFEARLADQRELIALLNRRQHIVERREWLVRRASERFESFIDTKYSEHGSSNRSIGARFELSIVPEFPGRQILTQAEALELLRSDRLDWRQVGFPRQSIGTVSQHESAIVLRPGSNFSILELNTWGAMFYATEIEEKKEQYSGIHLYNFLGQLLVFLHHARLMTERMQMHSGLKITLRFEGVIGVSWIYAENNMPLKGPSSPLDDSFEISLDTSSRAIRDDPDLIATELLNLVLFSMNWPQMVDGTAKHENLIELAYSYNFWPWPPKNSE